MRARLIFSAALLAPLATLSAQQTVDGWRTTMTMTVDSGDGRPHVTTSRSMVTEGFVRTEFTSSDNTTPGAAIARGSFMIINAHDSTIVMVIPSQQMATITPSAFMGAAQVELPAFTSHTTSSTRTDLGPGEKILGHDTHHYRTTSSGSFDATMYGKTCTREVNGSGESWVATDIDPMPMFETQMRAYGPSLVARFDSARKTITPSDAMAGGFPLRTRRTETYTDSTGHTHDVVMTMEYTEFEHGPLDRSLFEVPADYRVMDLRNMPGVTKERVAAMTRARPNPLCPKTP